MLDHVIENRNYWDGMADDWIAAGKRSWAATEPFWGIWGIPESDLDMLPDDMSGMTAIELGCGTAYVSSWMQRRGADVTGIDNSPRQLETARKLARDHALQLKLIHGNAEQIPFPDAVFDFALICTPLSGDVCDARLHRNYFELHRLDWSEVEIDPGGIEFNLPISEWMRLFRDTGFSVLDYREIRAPDSASGTQFATPAEWAKQWPSEQVWKLRKYPEKYPE